MAKELIEVHQSAHSNAWRLLSRRLSRMIQPVSSMYQHPVRVRCLSYSWYARTAFAVLSVVSEEHKCGAASNAVGSYRLAKRIRPEPFR
ncbi:hypothetical protein PROAA_1670002 [Candidatus Propionivibrio aalborgensis]|uniref:Uncharacterized protein n=1 Tax=Candidatus Propionivibrio aalborgensis TaxID=1860101 RepID=A0A1A8XM38_9RHOO|nr:hypothetical protein PROAA_1670002 [Candidatus Propionivibrio aalborgensis]